MATINIGEFLLAKSWQLVILCLLVACSAVVNSAETACFSLSRGDLFNLSQDPRRLHRLVPALMRNSSAMLTAVLLCINVIQILYFVLCSLLIVGIESSVRGGQWWGPVFAAATFLLMVLPGEVLPKSLAFLYPRQIAPRVAPIMATLVRVAHPIHRLLYVVLVAPLTRLLAPSRRPGALAAEEMTSLLTLSQKRGLLGSDQTELLQEVLELTDLRAGDIMVPRVDMVAFEAGSSRQELLELVRQRRMGKVPVYESDLDHILGVVHVKRLLLEEKAPRELVQPAQFVPQHATLERVLLQLRATAGTLAIVVDEYGGTAGLLTLENVVEEIVGDIREAREAAGPQAVTQVSANEWLIDGDLPVHEWAEAFGADIARGRVATVGGLVTSLLGHIPAVGETAERHNVTFTVEAMRRRRVALVRVRLKEKS